MVPTIENPCGSRPPLITQMCSTAGFDHDRTVSFFCRELSYVSVALPHHSTQGLTALMVVSLCLCKNATPLLQHPKKSLRRNAETWESHIRYHLIIAKLINFLLIERADLFWCTFWSINVLNR